MTVLGATGLVGHHLVRLLAGAPGVREILAPTRRVVRRWDDLSGVQTPLVDFEDLDAVANEWVGNQIFLCLGTTMRKAGSREAFRKVDLEYTEHAARLAAERGAQDAFLVSAAGADPDSRVFYLRTKGEAEAAVSALSFRSVHLLRPSLLTGERAELRPAEKLGALVGSALAPLMVGPLKRHRPIAAETVARAMVRLAAEPGEGVHVHESDELAELGAEEV